MNERQLAVHAKCCILEEMGFQIEHEDSRVSWKGYIFDFSKVEATRPAIFDAALREMWGQGFEMGKLNMQQDFRNLLGIGEVI